MLKLNKRFAIPMIEMIWSGSHSNSAPTDLISAIRATVCSDINATLLSEGAFQEMSPGTLADVLSDPMSDSVMAGHQKAIFRELIAWAKAAEKTPMLPGSLLEEEERLCGGGV